MRVSIPLSKGRSMKRPPLHKRPIEFFHSLDGNAGRAATAHIETHGCGSIPHCDTFVCLMLPEHGGNKSGIKNIARAGRIDNVGNAWYWHFEHFACYRGERRLSAASNYYLLESAPFIVA